MFRPPPISTLFPTRRSSDLASECIRRIPPRRLLRGRFAGSGGREFPGRQPPSRRHENTSPPAKPPLRLSALRCGWPYRSEEHTSELQSLRHLVCRLLLEKKN